MNLNKELFIKYQSNALLKYFYFLYNAYNRKRRLSFDKFLSVALNFSEFFLALRVKRTVRVVFSRVRRISTKHRCVCRQIILFSLERLKKRTF